MYIQAAAAGRCFHHALDDPRRIIFMSHNSPASHFNLLPSSVAHFPPSLASFSVLFIIISLSLSGRTWADNLSVPFKVQSPFSSLALSSRCFTRRLLIKMFHILPLQKVREKQPANEAPSTFSNLSTGPPYSSFISGCRCLPCCPPGFSSLCFLLCPPCN